MWKDYQNTTKLGDTKLENKVYTMLLFIYKKGKEE